MEIKKAWRVGVALAGLIGLGAVACSSGSAAPAAAPQVAKVLIVTGDMVTGSGGTTKASASCVEQSQYRRGNQIVWRAKVYDPATGKALDASALKSVVVKLSDGETIEAKYGDHPAKTPTDSFWATSWVVPDNFPTGSLNYQVIAQSNDGRTGTFTPFNVVPSLLTIVQ